MIALAEPQIATIDADAADADARAPAARRRDHERQPRAGATPNLYLGASARGGRRALGPNLISLPPPSRLATENDDASSSAAAAPFARQSSELWRVLHRRGGLLTTSRFACALGFREPRAAKSLGVPVRLVGHGPLVEVCRHLAGALEAEAMAVASSADAAGRRHNARALWDVNFGDGDDGGDSASDDDDHDNLRRRRDAESAEAARCGPLGIAMSLGLAQEWPSLYELSGIFPSSLIEECGLRLVAPKMLLWSEEEEAAATPPPPPLPPMGASPDAIIAHAVRLGSAKAALALLQRWRARLPPALADALRSVGEEQDDNAEERLWSVAAPAFVAAAGEEAARLVARRMWHDALRLVAVNDDDSTSENEGASDLDSDDGDEAAVVALATELSAAAALLDALLAPAGGDLSRGEAGVFRRRRRRRQQQQGLPLTYEEEGNDSSTHLAARRAVYRGVLERAMAEAEEDEEDNGGALPMPACCFVAAARSRQSGNASTVFGYLLLREAVEIKNTSPFRGVDGKKKKKNKGGGSNFLLSDGDGARDSCRVIALWAPQAQLHCLAAGLPSLLLMQRSVTGGTVVWRVGRDDAWLAKATALVRRLVGPSGFVGPGRPPPPHDCFFDQPGYGPFLAHTRRVALGAVRVAETRGSGGLLSSSDEEEEEEEEEESGALARRRRRRPARFPADADRRFFVD